MTQSYQSQFKTILLLVLMVFANSFAFANDDNSNPWSEISEREFAYKEMQRPIVPKKYRTFKLDMQALQNQLADAPLRFSAVAEEQSVILLLPLPNGEMERFEIYDAPIMEAELAAQFPMIHSYAGVGIDDPTASLRFDVTQLGFHALVLSAKHGSIYIDPYSKEDTEHYITYFKKDFEKIGNAFECHLQTELSGIGGQDFVDDVDVNSLSQGDCQLRTYRLALSCTGEYAAFHNGTTNSVMAAMNTTMTRVNGIFERDLNVNMILVNGNENLIFLDANTDPYDDNDTGQLINESHVQCNTIIGNPNYDIGHVFSTGGGGLAGLGVVCNSGNKGRGVTGTNNPIGDPFDVDYVAHEIGHQFGANHTFNNSCGGNRNGTTSVEPGSGSSIMGYAGICGPNVQFNSDDYFHAMSIQEITNHITGNGNSCANKTNTGNNPPTVVAGADYVLPISTPFKLTATGNDVDGDAITYCWEQMDNEIANMPPVATNTEGPSFRSLDPTVESHRYFPKLEDIVNGVNSDWEELPSVSRNMNFRVTVRDNHQGSGCTEEDDVQLTFSNDAGPFLVQSPNMMETWMVGAAQQVTWDVANTNNVPVNCANVNIMLSTDGGMNYTTTLAENVPNNGTATISVPNIESTNCRVMVVCADNIFFDISDNNFTIEAPSQSTFLMNVDSPVQDICGSVGSVDYIIDLTGLAGFNEQVTLSVLGLPANATESFSQNNFVPNGASVLTIGNLENVQEGEYYFSLIAASPSITIENSISVIVNNSVPSMTVLNQPINGAAEQYLDVTLVWNPVTNATNYQVEIATSPAFGNDIVETVMVDNNTFTSASLDNFTVYYWRVVAHNNCGQGSVPQYFNFQTGGQGCTVFESADIPLTISQSQASTVSSTLNMSHDVSIVSIKPTVEISHSWVGDLKTTLKSPAGVDVVLFDQVGIPSSQYGCNGDNALLTFDDNATNTATDLESACGAGNYSLQGNYQPIGSLAALTGQSTAGNWILEVQDFVNEDGGALEAWSVEVCFDETASEFTSYTNNPLYMNAGMTEIISNDFLNAVSVNVPPQDVRYVIKEMPVFGVLLFNGNVVTVGTTFSQKDINDFQISYLNTETNTQNDYFHFEVSAPDGAWLQNEIFYIEIVNTISANVYTANKVSCFNGNDGEIVAEVYGGTPPFSFNINGGQWQPEEKFKNLTAGTYMIAIQDFSGNTFNKEIVLENPPLLDATHIVDGNTITITATGGTGVLRYSLNGETPQTQNSFVNVPPGTHLVNVTDENDCQKKVSNIVVGAQPISGNVFVENPIYCFGDSEGILFVEASGGFPPYTYSLNGGAYQADPSFYNLSAGTYLVNIQDNQGEIFPANTVVMDNPEEIFATASVDAGSITIDAYGGTGNLMYSIVGGNTQQGNIFYGLNIGTYTVIVTDANGCSFYIENIEIITAPTITASVFVESPVICYNDNNGILFVQASGGELPYNYSIDGGAYQADPTFYNLSAGTYTVMIQDGLGSVISQTAVLTNPQKIQATYIVDNTSIKITASGGVGALSYSLNGGQSQPNSNFDNAPDGLHTVVITDENGCTFTIENIVIGSTSFVASLNIESNISCHDSNDGILYVSVSGGVTPLTYSLNGSNFQSQSVFENLLPGMYEVLVKDNEGKSYTTEKVILENPDPISAVVDVSGNIVTIIATGGTGAYTYNIGGSNFSTNNVFTDLPNGSFVFTIKDENGCLYDVDATVNIVFAADVTTQNVLCNNEENGWLSIDSIVGGQPNYLYSIDGNNFSATTLYENLAPGNYNVFVMDASGFVVTVGSYAINNAPNLSITAFATDNNITANGLGGTGTLMYTINGIDYQESNVFENLPNGTYSVTVVDENGCSEVTNEMIIDITAVNDLKFDISFDLFPNPNQGQFTIELNQVTEQNLTLQVFDVVGKLVTEINLDKNQTYLKEEIQLSNLPAGSYEILLTDGKMFGRKRFIKQ